MNIKRLRYQDLINWKNKKHRKPLLLQGARQVGKTWLLKEFGKNEFSNTAYFNFEEQPELKEFFTSSKDPERIIANLTVVNKQAIEPNKTLIIFDEIQECDEALNTLKYFNEKAPEYAVIGSGSLLGVHLSNNKSFPVGQVDFLYLNPVSFKEFLQLSAPNLFDYLGGITKIEPIPQIFAQELTEKLRLYFITGGMPEAIKTIVETNDITELQTIQRNILNAYTLDFSKHISTKDIPKTHYVWRSIPSQLSRENKKFLYQTVKSGARAREYENAILWLKDAGLVHIVNRISKSALPLSSYADLSAFKVYLLDVGLLRELARLHPDIIQQGNRLFQEFKGAFAENYVLQSLVNQFEEPVYYWTSGNRAELDFVFQYHNSIIPAEVKADTNIRSKSLNVYEERYKPEVMIRYSLKNLGWQNKILNIPLFLADYTNDLIKLI